MIKTVGVSAHFENDYTIPRTLQAFDCYITVTLCSAESNEDWAEVWMGGDLEDQCDCSSNHRNWDRILNHGQDKFIELAMKHYRADLRARLYSPEFLCEACGNPYGKGGVKGGGYILQREPAISEIVT